MSSHTESPARWPELALFALGLASGVLLWRSLDTRREPLELLPSSAGELVQEPRRWSALTGDASVPPEVRAAASYLEQRYGHLGDPGLALACTSAGGEDVYVSAQPIAGVNGEGVPVYAIVYGRARPFTGRVHESPPPSSGGFLYVPPVDASATAGAAPTSAPAQAAPLGD